MGALFLRSVPFWLAGIDTKRMSTEMRPVILRYQREVVDVLYAWASTPKVSSMAIVPTEPQIRPVSPSEDAPLVDWREYYQRMLTLVKWQMDMEQWQGTVEGRLEGLEAMSGLIPDILDRLGPQTLTPEHQRAVPGYVHRLSQLSSRPYGTIYNDLKTVFAVPRYQDVPEGDWPQLEQWFKTQIQRAQQKG